MTIYSISAPYSMMSESQLRTLRTRLQQQVAAIVASEANLGPDLIAVRDLTPGDFSGQATDGIFQNQVQGIANTFVAALDADPTLNDNECWGIYGIMNQAAIPTLTQVRFGIGSAATIAQFQVDAALQMDKVAIFQTPVIYRPGEVFNWDLLFSGTTAADAEVMALLGFVAEKAGTTITSRA